MPVWKKSSQVILEIYLVFYIFFPDFLFLIFFEFMNSIHRFLNSDRTESIKFREISEKCAEFVNPKHYMTLKADVTSTRSPFGFPFGVWSKPPTIRIHIWLPDKAHNTFIDLLNYTQFSGSLFYRFCLSTWLLFFI
jgi:hypothetical protein